MATWAGPPRAYTKGRVRPVQYVVIHSTEGSEGINSAEAGVAYDKVRLDGTSTHLFVDSNNALMEVRYSDTAHAARTHGNACGIQVELCGVAGQTAAQWHDAASLPMLRIAAKEVAAICREFGLPVRRLSPAEVRAAYYNAPGQRPKGICGHVDVTKAYPEDQGSHTDPGPNFPWSEFLAMVAAEMGGSSEGDDMPRYFQLEDQSAGRYNGCTYEFAPSLEKLTAWQAAHPGPTDKLKRADLEAGVHGVNVAATVAPPAPGGGLTEAQVRDIAEQEAHTAIAATTLAPPALT